MPMVTRIPARGLDIRRCVCAGKGCGAGMEHQAVWRGQGVEAQAERHDSLLREADAMTEPLERPQSVPSDLPQRPPEGEPLPAPVDARRAVEQLRDAGFSDDQQAALTTALLRVLALWTQQATRGDVHAEQQALAQQLDARHADLRRDIGYHADAIREDLRREIAQHADALREELQGALAQQAELLRTTRAAPARRW